MVVISENDGVDEMMNLVNLMGGWREGGVLGESERKNYILKDSSKLFSLAVMVCRCASGSIRPADESI